jgi:hypothetical protein
MEAFEIAGGSVAGRAHVHARRNNQDAWHSLARDGVAVALVADGCGSGRRSEAGALLGVRILAEALAAAVSTSGSPELVLESARVRLLETLATLVDALTPDGRETRAVATDYLLFTLVGAVLTPAWTAVFALGDGLAFINGERSRVAYPDDTPPYAAYALTGSSLTDTRPDLLRFRILRTLPTEDVESILVGTDGVADLERAGPLRRFWEDDRSFSNPSHVARRLHLANDGGRALLPDDTTLVVVRRRRSACTSTSTASA